MKEITRESIEQGKRIQQLRLQKNIKQEELSLLCNISVPYISRMEQGHVNISSKTLQLMATALGCSIEYLRDGIECDKCSSNDIVQNERDGVTIIENEEIKKNLNKLLAICDEDMRKSLINITNWLNDYACTRKAMENMPPSDIGMFYDNCCRYIENISSTLEDGIVKYQEYSGEDY